MPTNWTGSLTAVKIQYFPDNMGNATGSAVLLLTGTGSSCPWPGSSGAMTAGGGTNAAMASNVNTLFNFLAQAKKDGTTVTITYDPAITNCPISSVTR